MAAMTGRVSSRSMRFAYADPPYFGCCRLYDHHHPDGLCWDDLDTHRQLIDRLCEEYPDGWAMSATSVSLRVLLPLCPPDVRVGAWVKPFHAYKKGVRPAYAWEPIIYRGGRNAKHPPPLKGGKATTPKDFIACNITLKKGLTGAKPEAVCDWICDLLNVQEGDELVDLYVGTGVMDRVSQMRTMVGRQMVELIEDAAARQQVVPVIDDPLVLLSQLAAKQGMVLVPTEPPAGD